MTEQIHPLAIHHLPVFVTPPGETDGLFVAMGLVVLFGVIGIGVFYFKLHALPEHLAHNGQKIQYEIVAVLALLALFTHNHAFWIAGLLLALIRLPDFTTPLQSIAGSLERLAGGASAAPAQEPAPASKSAAEPAPAPAPDAARHEVPTAVGQSNGQPGV
jgi:hypothetical protein